VNDNDNTANANATTEYRQWLRQQHGPAHARRTAERNAAFLLPFLKPGMTLLDAGCGPGSITIGLAGHVAPAEVTGIDLSAESIGLARDLAAERGVTNVRFDVADVYALPFDDATFDAAFSHALLQHLSDPLAALREIRRVLKPGGVIGLADADLGSGVVYPSSPGLERASEIAIGLREAEGGTPRVGRGLRELLFEAGFPHNAAFVQADCDGARETVERAAAWQAAYVEAPPFVARVTGLGIATEVELREIAAAWRAWGGHPGAFAARYWNQAVGWAE